MNCKRPIQCFPQYNDEIRFTSTTKQTKWNFPSCGGHIGDSHSNSQTKPEKLTRQNTILYADILKNDKKFPVDTNRDKKDSFILEDAHTNKTCDKKDLLDDAHTNKTCDKNTY